MATHGCLSEYTSAEDWASYVERMDQYFLANDVTEAAKKRAILLSVVGDKTYKLIRDLTAVSVVREKQQHNTWLNCGIWRDIVNTDKTWMKCSVTG